jgi:hypothetical protein
MEKIEETEVQEATLEIDLTKEEMAVVERTEDRLKFLSDNGSTDDDDDDADGDNPPAAETKSEEKTPTPKAEEPAAKAEESSNNEPTPSGDVEVPDAYYRAAIHQGWKPEQIDDFVKQNPGLALQTLENMYKSTNKISQEFARIGRVAPSGSDQAKPVGQQNQPPQSSLKPLDLTEMIKVYGEDDPAIKTIQALHDQLTAISSQMNATKPAANEATKATENDLIEQSVDSFFTNDDIKPYSEFYGEGKVKARTRTMEQEERRWKVLDEADRIRDGAAKQGIQMDIPEALERAHLIVSDSFKTQAIRKSIVSDLKKKSKGLTLKPNNSSPGSQTNNRESLEDKTANRLATLKW